MDQKKKRTKVPMIVSKLFREELNEDVLLEDLDRRQRIGKKRLIQQTTSSYCAVQCSWKSF